MPVSRREQGVTENFRATLVVDDDADMCENNDIDRCGPAHELLNKTVGIKSP